MAEHLLLHCEVEGPSRLIFLAGLVCLGNMLERVVELLACWRDLSGIPQIAKVVCRFKVSLP